MSNIIHLGWEVGGESCMWYYEFLEVHLSSILLGNFYFVLFVEDFGSSAAPFR